MARSRLVQPEVTVLRISEGDTLTVKRRLNEGEHRAMLGRQYHENAQGELKTNLFQVGIAEILAYLVDWSLVGTDGKVLVIRDQPIAVVSSVLDSLDPDDVREIRQAITAHVEAMAAERAASKKIPDGESKSSAISPSPDGTAGVTSTSPN